MGFHLYKKIEVERSEWENVMKFRSFGDSTSSRLEDKLKTIRLCSRSIEYKRAIQ